ncbi:MAG: hypothetical protein ACXVCP_14125 [Bdellovibrio sp.]
MKLISIFCILLAATSTLAGVKDVGNGGDAIVCRNPQGVIQTAELLDYYEARTNFDWQINEAGNLHEILNRYLERLGKVNSYRIDEYRQRIEQFFAEAKFLNNVELVDIPDSDHTSFPHGCKVEQLVIQKSDLLPGEKRYTINKDIWDVLDAKNQAGIILHEIVYRETLGQHSRYVRYFVGLVASNNLMNLSLPQQDELFNNLGTREFIIPPAKYRISYYGFDEHGAPKEITISANGDLFNKMKLNGIFKVVYNGGKIASVSGFDDSYFEAELPFSGETIQAKNIEFHTNGAIKSLNNVKGSHTVQNNAIRTALKCLERYDIKFFANGDLRSCLVDVSNGLQFWQKTDRYEAKFYLRFKADKAVFELNDQGYFTSSLEIAADGKFLIGEKWFSMNDVGFSDNGLVSRGQFAKPTRFVFNAVPFVFEAGKTFLFYSNGIIEMGSIVGTTELSVEGQTLSIQSKHMCKFKQTSKRGDFLYIDESGHVINAVVAQTKKILLNGKKYTLKKNDQVNFAWDEKGKLYSIDTYSWKCY